MNRIIQCTMKTTQTLIRIEELDSIVEDLQYEHLPTTRMAIRIQGHGLSDTSLSGLLYPAWGRFPGNRTKGVLSYEED